MNINKILVFPVPIRERLQATFSKQKKKNRGPHFYIKAFPAQVTNWKPITIPSVGIVINLYNTNFFLIQSLRNPFCPFVLKKKRKFRLSTKVFSSPEEKNLEKKLSEQESEDRYEFLRFYEVIEIFRENLKKEKTPEREKLLEKIKKFDYLKFFKEEKEREEKEKKEALKEKKALKETLEETLKKKEASEGKEQEQEQELFEETSLSKQNLFAQNLQRSNNLKVDTKTSRSLKILYFVGGVLVCGKLIEMYLTGCFSPPKTPPGQFLSGPRMADSCRQLSKPSGRVSLNPSIQVYFNPSSRVYFNPSGFLEKNLSNIIETYYSTAILRSLVEKIVEKNLAYILEKPFKAPVFLPEVIENHY